MTRIAFEPIERRKFLKQVGGAAAFGFTENSFAAPTRRIALIVDPNDAIASSRPAKWAAEQLRQQIIAKGVAAQITNSPRHLPPANSYIVVAGTDSVLTKEFAPGRIAPQDREAFAFRQGNLAGKPAVLVSGSDPRGLVYGLLEIGDRARFSADPQSIVVTPEAKESPANQVRSSMRAFLSEVEDKHWYYDKDFWRAYLSTLVTHRFNRFSLAFGFGYDFPVGVTGDYFHFPYPYLLEVPGYDVRVIPLSNAERDRNLETLQFIAAETAKRGLEFQLGIWTHAYQWVKSPQAHHRIEGLTPETHAAYCRDALGLLLKTCPEIQGLTLRVHGESGIPEGSYSFWQTVFEGISRSGRKIEIDMHAKGVDQKMIDVALATGMPVTLSPKFWAEHMGLPYHQADIRELEIPRSESDEHGTFKLSDGSRRFLRYGYGDLFKKERQYRLLFRLWPGTQRMLLWGDPVFAAGYGRASHFCGASGLEICEPLVFKGREGSGLPGGRCAYKDQSFNPGAGDYAKYLYTYRLWGRLLYHPDADPETWRRYLRTEFGSGASNVEDALGHASRILPLVTTAHLPSASNHAFWPEIYTNMPIVPGSEHSPYGDTPEPKRFGTVSPLDPQLFSTIEAYCHELLTARSSGKYSPIDAAQWLEDFAAKSSQSWEIGRKRVASTRTPEFRRAEEDIHIQIGLGQFFAAKLRAGVLFEIYVQTKDKAAGQQALAYYRKARERWAAMAQRAQTVYVADITYGSTPYRRGHWVDRLPAIDQDIEAMQSALQHDPQTANTTGKSAGDAIREATGHRQRREARCIHTPPAAFTPGEALPVSVRIDEVNVRENPTSARLLYRRVNHAERWQTLNMQREKMRYKAAIPATYTESAFPLQYYFELRRGENTVWLYPGFDENLSNQPYFVVQRKS